MMRMRLILRPAMTIPISERFIIIAFSLIDFDAGSVHRCDPQHPPDPLHRSSSLLILQWLLWPQCNRIRHYSMR
jgi:hypothetical protein